MHVFIVDYQVPFADRQSIQDFCTNAIEQLVHAKIASLWILKVQDNSHPVIATLTSLISYGKLELITELVGQKRKKTYSKDSLVVTHLTTNSQASSKLMCVYSSVGVAKVKNR